MEESKPGPTPYDGVNDILAVLLANIWDVLGEEFVGMYLYGSLSSGDFDPYTSDIDFLVVTEGLLPDETVEALGAMHARVTPGPQAGVRDLEGCYIPRAEMRRYDPGGAPYPIFHEGQTTLGRHGSDWMIQCHILREHGVVVAGPSPREMIDPVSPDDLRRGATDVLQGWWVEQADHPDWLREKTVLQVFTVQTMCRALYTLRHGDILSKPAAIRWGMAALDPPWSALASQASTWKEGMPFAPLDETLAFIRYAVGKSGDQTAKTS